MVHRPWRSRGVHDVNRNLCTGTDYLSIHGQRTVGAVPTIDDLMQQLHENVCAQLNQVDDGGLSNDGLDATIIALPHDGGALQFCGAQMVYSRFRPKVKPNGDRAT